MRVHNIIYLSVFLICSIHIDQSEASLIGNVFQSVVNKIKQVLNRSVCYEDAGCFSTGGDFYHPIFRPISLLPLDPKKMDLEYVLYTRTNRNGENLNKDNIATTNFDGSKRTMILIHGYLDIKMFASWTLTLKDNILDRWDYNVINLYWHSGNVHIYPQVASNTQVVGALLAQLIHSLQVCVCLFLNKCISQEPYQEVKGQDYSQVHLIGHSLGAQVAGYAGQRLQGKVGRITGLDPAGPMFEHLPPTVRLDPTDAQFVDVIHTNIRSSSLRGKLQFGSSHTVGHLDFYPNGGGSNESAQPGCMTQTVRSLFGSGFVEPARRLVACSHMRSLDYFMASIQQENCYVAAHCSSWSDYESGKCSCDDNNCAMMGIAADEYKQFLNGSDSLEFYLKTAELPPFCVQQYLVTVELSPYQRGVAHGSLKLVFQGSNGRTESILINQNYQYIITLPREFEISKSVALKFEPKSLLFGFFKSSKVPVISKVSLKSMTIGSCTEYKSAPGMYSLSPREHELTLVTAKCS